MPRHLRAEDRLAAARACARHIQALTLIAPTELVIDIHPGCWQERAIILLRCRPLVIQVAEAKGVDLLHVIQLVKEGSCGLQRLRDLARVVMKRLEPLPKAVDGADLPLLSDDLRVVTDVPRHIAVLHTGLQVGGSTRLTQILASAQAVENRHGINRHSLRIHALNAREKEFVGWVVEVISPQALQLGEHVRVQEERSDYTLLGSEVVGWLSVS
ncbi:Uncharacterised protein [Mycobacteroides abscessus subsp. abscessus]|nr:Uncharacterised protein [Mycobacteroides abscessus subsp. abscessus]